MRFDLTLAWQALRRATPKPSRILAVVLQAPLSAEVTHDTQ